MCSCILNSHITMVNSILNPEINNVNMTQISNSAASFIYLHYYRTFVILENNIIFKFVSLCFHEIHKPYIIRKIFCNIYYFWFCSTFVFTLFIDYFSFTKPTTIDINPPIWLLMLSCTTYDASIYVNKCVSNFAPIFLTSLIFIFDNPKTIINFIQYPSSPFYNLCIKYDTDVSISGLSIFII